MAKSRKKEKAKAEEAVEALFDESLGESAESLEKQASAASAGSEEDRLAADLLGPQPPPHVPDARGDERAWESYPIADGQCPKCVGRMRVVDVGLLRCRRGHETVSARAAVTAINAGEVPGVSGLASGGAGDAAVSVAGAAAGATVAKKTRFARVAFVALETTRLARIEYDLADEVRSQVDVAGAFVKVSAELRPSEREGFDGRALKDQLRSRGARAVLLDVKPVAEAPVAEAKAEAAVAASPEAAVAAWFDGLPVPEEDRVAAREQALVIIAAESGS